MRKCKACSYCKMLYIRRGVKYLREKKLYCTLRNKILSAGDDCENRQSQKAEYDLSAQRFDSVLEDIMALINSELR